MGYSLEFTQTGSGLEINVVGLSDESIIMYLITSVMKSKFSSLTSIVLLYIVLLYMVYYYTSL